jgi:3,4-dihydroxy 2-butanone 4-phosphate synthase/GTP cyclohydrolase II
VLDVNATNTHSTQVETMVECIATARLPTRHGSFVVHTYRSVADGGEHVALVLGSWLRHEPVLVRIHSECLTGDVFGSTRCDCGPQLDEAMARIAQARCGIVVYLRGHEGRGIGLAQKLHAYRLQDAGRDTVQANADLGFAADLRSYDSAAHILRELGVERVRLLTNNPRKLRALEACGLTVAEREPLVVAPTRDNARYLRAKQEKLGHLLDLPARSR